MLQSEEDLNSVTSILYDLASYETLFLLVSTLFSFVHMQASLNMAKQWTLD